MKLFVVGHGRHGKDTVAEIIRDKYGLTFESSSMFCAERVVIPFLTARGITYESSADCYADRINHRESWYEAIREFNKGNEARLSASIFEENNIYVGIRSRIEFLAAKDLADLSIWVDASDRIPQIDPTCKILASDCDIILDNNGALSEISVKITRLFDLIYPPKIGAI